MASRPVKLKLAARPTLKLKGLARFPANVIGSTGINVTQDGTTLTISMDLSSVIGTAVQAHDDDLDAIAALTGVGLLQRDGPGSWEIASAGSQGEVFTSGLSSPSFIPGVLNVKAFGATGDGATNDTSAIQSALDAGGFGIVYFPAGTYMCGSLTGASSKIWLGDGKGITTLKCRSTIASGSDWIYFSAKTNFGFSGITFDGNSNLTDLTGGHFPSLMPCIHITGSSRAIIHQCEFIGFTTLGLLTNTSHSLAITKNTITRSAAHTGAGMTAGNYGMLIGGTGTVDANNAYDVLIDGNTLTNCQISTSGHEITISNNTVTGWGFSSGINTQGLASNFNNRIVGNTCYNSNHAQDSAGFYPAGIENWAATSVVANNVCYGNAGAGIAQAGKNVVVSDNVCYNNGQSVAAGGIESHYQDATFNASGSLVTGNKCFDNQTPKTQAYGYFEAAALASGSDVNIAMNDFGGNLTADVSLQSISRQMNMNTIVALDNAAGFSGGVFQLISSLGLAKSGFNLFIAPGSTALTTNRTLTIETNNADRVLSISGGNVTFSGPFVTIGGSTLQFTTSGATAITWPAVTDTAAVLGTAQTFTANQSFNSSTFILKGSSSGTLTVKPAAAAGSNTLTLPAGTTDFSATGGTSQVVKQTSSGGALTVAQLAASDLSNGTTGSNSVVLATSPTLVTPVLGAATATTINGVTLDNTAWTSYTPTVTASTGTFTTVSATGKSKQIGKVVFYYSKVTCTTVGTAAGRMIVTLPSSSAGAGSGLATGFNDTSFKNVSGIVEFDANGKVSCMYYDGTFPITSGQSLYIAGLYET